MITALSLRRFIGTVAVLLFMHMFCAPPLRAGQTDVKAPPLTFWFGFKVVPLPNGNLVVVSSGAVYLYSPDGVMISKLTGSDPDPRIEILVLSNGHYVVRSPGWGNDKPRRENVGAVTWCNGVTGLNGRISAENSLVGSTGGDMHLSPDQSARGGMVALSNGNYVVSCPGWDNGRVRDAGAVTWCDGNGGTVGVISPENSLIGSTANDQVGSTLSGGGVTPLSNGDYVVSCPGWDNASVRDAGFAAWCSGVTGRVGAVSAESALTGVSTHDQVGGGMKIGRGVTALVNGNYVVCSPLWDSGTVVDAGAVTWCPAGGGLRGPVTVKNSLTGSTASDSVGAAGAAGVTAGVTALNDGHYVVASSKWDNGRVRDAGAVTWCDGFAGTTGPVSVAASLTGSQSAAVGSGGVFALPDGGYAVCTPSWGGVGAVTRIFGGQPFSGDVSRGNSVTGIQQGDAVGSGGVTVLANGNFVISSPDWSNGDLIRAGAVTWCDGKVRLGGTVSSENSLTGSSQNDRVGYGAYTLKGVTALTNGNYVVCSPSWDHGEIQNAGAVTWCSGSTGGRGAVTAANSLTGSSDNDSAGGGTQEMAGGVTALTNGNYVVSSLPWRSGVGGYQGAVTWGDGMVGITGPITTANSLTGLKPRDNIGSGGVTALTGGDYVVLSPRWDNPATERKDAGAVTLGDGKSGTTGLIHPGNSVPGEANYGGAVLSFAAQAGGTGLVVGQPDAKMISFFTPGAPAKPVVRVEQPKGIEVSGADFGTVSMGGVKAMQFFIKNPGYVPLRLESVTLRHPSFALTTVPSGPLGPGDSGGVMVTFSPSSSGPQSAVLRIVGEDGSEGSPCEIILKGMGAERWPAVLKDLAGPPGSGRFGHSVTLLPNGNFVVTDPWFDLPGPVTDAGAVYLYSSGNTLLSTLTGSSAGDRVGIGGVTVLKNGHYVIRSPFWKNGFANDAGAVTWADGGTGVNGVISAGNSLVGYFFGDLLGEKVSSAASPELNSPMPEGVTALENGNYVVCSPRWNGGAGAVTWCDGSAGARGVLTAERSLTGVNGQQAGSRGVVALKNGNYVVITPGWWDSQDPTLTGAVTWGSGVAGVSGMISEGNSLVGTRHLNEEEESFNIGEVAALANGNYVVCSPLWQNGEAVSAGAVTWGNGAAGVTGRITHSNSLTGTSTDDQVGGGFPVILQNGNYVILSPGWDGNGVENAGAVTWCSGASAVTGPVSGANSLIGSRAEDRAGDGGVTALTNGNYVVYSRLWHNGATGDDGAVTWADGAVGLTGPVSAANSLTGGAGTLMGSRVTALADGNYVVRSPNWNNSETGLAIAGAVTWGNGTTGLRGLISGGNSLTGLHEHDGVGSDGVTALPGGAFVVCSSIWNKRKGAVTWCGPGGRPGESVSALNSLVGTDDEDAVGLGGVTVLTNGNYVVSSPEWGKRFSLYSEVSYGAVTWCGGGAGRTGEISSLNSLTGTGFTDSHRGGVTALSNGNYLVDSPSWTRDWGRNFGALTWGDGFQDIQGGVSWRNSLTETGSVISDAKRTSTFGTGHYAVFCPTWGKQASAGGAVVLGTGRRAFQGPISDENSVMGAARGDGFTMSAAFRESDRTFIVGRPADNIVSLFRHRSDTEEEAILEQPGIGLIPDGSAYDFGVIPVGESASLVLLLKNTGSAALRIGGVETGGPPFRITSPIPGGTILDSGESTSLTLTFTPPAVGLYSSVLRLYSVDGSAGDIHRMTLSGASSPFGDNGGSPSVAVLPDRKIAVSFKALPGVGYLLQRSEDLWWWQTLETVTAGPEGEIHFTDAEPLFSRRYYRLRIP